MPLFCCSRCFCIENTALGHYWAAKRMKQPVTCSFCHKGVWHAEFDRKSVLGSYLGRSGFLYQPHELDLVPTVRDSIIGKFVTLDDPEYMRPETSLLPYALITDALVSRVVIIKADENAEAPIVGSGQLEAWVLFRPGISDATSMKDRLHLAVLGEAKPGRDWFKAIIELKEPEV